MSQISTFNDYEVQRVREIAESGRDEPVLMLNLNLYSADADFPNGGLFDILAHQKEGDSYGAKQEQAPA